MNDLALVQRVRLFREQGIGRKLTPYLLIAPVVLLLMFFLAYPLGVGIQTSLTDMRVGREAQAQFIGLRNYKLLIESGQLFTAIRVTLSLVLRCITMEMLLGLGLALLMNRQLRGIRFYRAISLIPFMVPTVVTGLMWRMLLDPQGAVNYLFGLGDFPWLSNTQNVLWGLTVIDVWQTTPQVVILLLAGLQTITKDIYEAAQIDGANAWQTFRFVTIPLLLPFFLISLMIRSIELIQVLDIVLVTTNGGPGDASLVLHVAAYRETFASGFIGYGTTLALMLGLIVLFVVLLISRRLQAAQKAAYD